MRFWATIALTLGLPFFTAAQTRPSSFTEWTVSERGAHHKVHTRLETVDRGNGLVEEIPHRYVSLASGMHYWDGTDWKESRERFEITPQGYAVAAEGQHKVAVSPVLNDVNGAVVLETPEGYIVRSGIMGLALRDRVTGASLWVAEIVAATGQQIAPNVILFEDCFDDVHADVRLVYQRGGFHQDVILRSAFDPDWLEINGFNATSARLEIWTSFLTELTPAIRQTLVSSVADPTLRALMAEPDVFNDDLSFGAMKFPLGRAYARRVQAPNESPVVVPKRWVEIEGGQYLVESIALNELQPLLAGLPPWQPSPEHAETRVLTAGVNPPSPNLTHPGTNRVLLANLDRPTDDTGVVLDYTTVLGNFTNHVLQADTTYHVTDPVNLYGTTTLEGGTVIKFGRGPFFGNTNSPNIRVYGELLCGTEPYRPAIFTSEDDDSVGETISGSSGSPSGTYGYPYYLKLNGNQSSARVLEYFRMVDAYEGIGAVDGSGYVFRHAQFTGCSRAIDVYDSSSTAENLLVHDGSYAFYPDDGGITAINCTLHDVSTVGYGTYTNCLFVNAGGLSGIESGSSHNATNASSSVFQTAGAGAHYLADNTYRNQGTAAIDSELAADLKRKTTYPPIVITNEVSTDATLSMQAGRDTDTPDIGFHYDPIDWIADVVRVTNATLTLTPGTVVAGYNDVAVYLKGYSAISAIGTPDRPIWFVGYQTVQEQPVDLGTWAPSDARAIYPYYPSAAGLPTGAFRFARFSMLANSGRALQHYQDWSFSDLTVEDSEFYSSARQIIGGDSSSARLWNSLFHRGTLDANLASITATLVVSNCTFLGLSSVKLHDINAGQVQVFDTVFDQCTFPTAGPGGGAKKADNGYNAYFNCNTNLLPKDTANSLFSGSAMTWTAGPSGDWYQPTTSPLVSVGSATAGLVGLYHYTTQTNLVKETNSVVDIGYHYVATDGSGMPLDDDNDGLADYLEDTDGDGSYGAGDLADWEDSDSDGDGLSDFVEVAIGTNPNDSNTTEGTEGQANLLVFTPLE